MNKNLKTSRLVLESQIDVLNEDYRRLNENSSETREEFLEFAGDQYEFFLAKYDQMEIQHLVLLELIQKGRV